MGEKNNKDANEAANAAIREILKARGVNPNKQIGELLGPKDGDLIQVRVVEDGKPKIIIAVKGGAR